MRRRVAHGVVVLAAAWLGCGRAPPLVRDPDPAPERRLELGSPAAALYNGPAEPAPRSAVAAAVLARLQVAAARAERPAPAPDARLYRAARDLASVVEHGAGVPRELLVAVVQRQGIIEPSAHLIVVWSTGPDAVALAEAVERRVELASPPRPYARAGIGVAKRGGETVTVVLLQQAHLTTAPIPRSGLRSP